MEEGENATCFMSNIITCIGEEVKEKNGFHIYGRDRRYCYVLARQPQHGWDHIKIGNQEGQKSAPSSPNHSPHNAAFAHLAHSCSLLPMECIKLRYKASEEKERR